MKILRTFGLLTAAILLLPVPGMATTISLNSLLTNPSFEGGVQGSGCPIGWSCTNFNVATPTSAEYPYNPQNGLASPAFVPNGSKAAYTPVTGSTTGQLKQSISGQQFVAGNSYELVFFVGNPLGGAFLDRLDVRFFVGSDPASPVSNTLCDSGSRVLGYSTTPVGGSTLSGTDTGSPCLLSFPNSAGYLPGDGDWQKYTLTFTTNATITGDIGVLFNVFPSFAAENGGLMHLDLSAPAATVTDVPVPEPGTLALLGAGFAYLGIRSRKKKR